MVITAMVALTQTQCEQGVKDSERLRSKAKEKELGGEGVRRCEDERLLGKDVRGESEKNTEEMRGEGKKCI